MELEIVFIRLLNLDIKLRLRRKMIYPRSNNSEPYPTPFTDLAGHRWSPTTPSVKEHSTVTKAGSQREESPATNPIIVTFTSES